MDSSISLAEVLDWVKRRKQANSKDLLLSASATDAVQAAVSSSHCPAFSTVTGSHWVPSHPEPEWTLLSLPTFRNAVHLTDLELTIWLD